MIEQTIEEFLFDIMDQCKILFFPKQWNYIFLDYTKNEVFALFFVYRKGTANMTEIADYLDVPLNTATGIISRLEKRGVIKRERDIVDKRIVTIAICQEGKDFLHSQFKELDYYYKSLMEVITDEERSILMKLLAKFIVIVSQDNNRKDEVQEKKKVVRKITIE